MSAVRKVRAPTLPLVTAEWSCGTRETIKVILDAHTIDVRSFFAGDEGEPMRRGRTGIALPISHLPALFDGVACAHREAIARGLIEERDHG